MIIQRLPHRVFHAFVSLYPRNFREQFADEMDTVFSQAAEEELARGPLALAVFLLREFSSLPANLIHEHLAPLKEISPGRRKLPESRPVLTAAWSALGYASVFSSWVWAGFYSPKRASCRRYRPWLCQYSGP